MQLLCFVYRLNLAGEYCIPNLDITLLQTITQYITHLSKKYTSCIWYFLWFPQYLQINICPHHLFLFSENSCFFWLIHVAPIAIDTPPGSEFTVDGRGTVIVLPNEDEVLEAIAVGSRRNFAVSGSRFQGENNHLQGVK